MHLYQIKHGRRRALIVSAAVFLIALTAAIALLGGAERRVSEEQRSALENALFRAAVTCYALEGRYPPTLEHLVDRYGVVVDESRFHVRYDVFAQNIMPDIEVYSIGEGGEPR